MKANNLIYILAAFLLFLSSCREISVSTIVNEDGSFTRIIEITKDSGMPDENDLPYPVDSTWERQENQDTTDGKTFSVTFAKRYENSELLNKELKMDTSWLKDIKREIDVKVRFWFFNSYVTYEETWKAANPFTELDYKEYLSEDDLEWITGLKLAINESDSAAMEEAEEKVEEFLKESLALEISNELMMESFQSYVEMPGIITETNSPSLMGNQVSWKISGLSFFFEDYGVIVESRIANTWAYVVAGIIFLVLVVVLIVKGRRG